MKRTYICPAVSIEGATVETNILAASGVKSEDLGIGFGGVDAGGDQTPGAKAWDNMWEE
jgi:hypothetical protein